MTTATQLEEIYTPVEDLLAKVYDEILAILETPNPLASEVIRYFFSARGKLLRPALTFFGARLAGVLRDPIQDLVRLGAAFEIFHSATLIHDDIIDEADLRRNLRTVHEKWNPKVAVLAGDYFHDKAMRVIFDLGNREIFSRFIRTASEVCEGEMREQQEKKNFGLTEGKYYEIIEKKTASLLACSVGSGALFAGCVGPQEQALSEFGRFFGLAFQITDDCLDFTGNENEFGKTLGSDSASGVLTLPVIRLIEVSGPSRREKLQGLLSEGTGPERFQELCAMLEETGAMAYAYGKALEFRARAREKLSEFPASKVRENLEKLLDYVLERNH